MAEYIRSIEISLEVDTNKQTRTFRNVNISNRAEAIAFVNDAFDSMED